MPAQRSDVLPERQTDALEQPEGAPVGYADSGHNADECGEGRYDGERGGDDGESFA